MPDFDPPNLAPDAAPDFTDASACTKWLRELPLVNVPAAHAALLEELEELNRCSIAPTERLKIMELLREPVTFVQKEYAKKIASRPAPLAYPERRIFADVSALWSALSGGYRHCLQAAADGSPGAGIALMCQRVLWCAGEKMVACYETYYDVPERDWHALHRAFAFSEERQVAAEEVAHPLRKNKLTSCTETYAQVLLLDLASPSKLTPRQIELISPWLEHWAVKVSVVPTPQSGGADMAPLCVDLEGSAGASRRVAQGEALRFLDLEDLRKSTRRRVGLLRKGESPASLGLGDDVTAPLAESLLMMLYRQWFEDKHSRALPRHGASGTAQICSGMAAIHYFVTGQTFRPRGGRRELSKAQHEEIATFGRVASRHEEASGLSGDFASETWQIKDESASGLRLERIDQAATARLVIGQLLGIRPADAKGFLLCTVRWLSVSAAFDLRIGVQILPGVPLGIAIRPASPTTGDYTQAFMLPAVAALRSPDTLVVPSGWFKPQRAIEVLTEGSHTLQLSAIVDRGSDFERVTVGAVPGG